MTEDAATDFPWVGYGLGGMMYAERDGKILIIRRAMGEATGLWGLPGGATEPDERPEQTAVRELFEETGLVPTSEPILIGLFPMHVYGRDAFMASYACECAEGEVVLNEEHSEYAWIEPARFRRRMDKFLESLGDDDSHIGRLVTEYRDDLDRYIAGRTRGSEQPS